MQQQIVLDNYFSHIYHKQRGGEIMKTKLFSLAVIALGFFAVAYTAVFAAAVSTYKIEQSGLASSYPVSTLVVTTGKTQAEINTEVQAAVSSLTPISVRLITDEVGDSGYSRVRIAPVAAGSHVQLWAKDIANNWYDINVVGWGPMSGFPIPATYDTTTPVYFLSDAKGDYTLTTRLVNVSASNAVITEGSVVAHVGDTVTPTVTVTPTPSQVQPSFSQPGPASAPEVCKGSLVNQMPLITDIRRVSRQSVFIKWTKVDDHIKNYVVEYGFGPFVLWATKVNDSLNTTINYLPPSPIKIWFRVAGTDDCVVGPFSVWHAR